MASNEEKIWTYLKSKGLNDYGCSGLMGNLYAESGLNPKNLQSTYEQKLGFSDDQYVKAVDNGTYANFVYDSAGFGLAQWTYWSRKKAFYEYAKSKNKSIGDLEVQLEFLYKELSESYSTVLTTLKNAKSVLEASNAVLLKVERPADQSVSVQNKRASYGQKYYDKYATGSNKEGEKTMGVKTYQENERVQLSKNFNSYEFRCGLGRPCACSTILIDTKLVEYLQKIRDHFGKSITITSGYRCPSYNKSVSKSTSSYHTKGMAGDIVVSGVAPREVAKYAESIGILGIGLYETQADGHFTHIDTRTTKSFWYGQAQSPRQTFGGSSSSSSNNNSSNLLKCGDSGNGVKALQEKLIALGYSCGGAGADGDYGSGTSNAVRKFQRDNGLSVDGIAGPKTLEAINKASKPDSNKVKVTANILNIRSSAGTNYAIKGTTKKGSVHEVLEEKNGWGKISNGWISLGYTEKV
jgi:hypothetical protein